MKEITLNDITQEDFDTAAQVVISGIKAYNRKLDTRDGTVLRDLLVNPEAAIESVTSGQIEEARKSSSLAMLKDAQEAGETIDQSDVDSILSNFNIQPTSGRKARGTIKVVVADNTSAYSISKGTVFTSIDGLSFEVDESIVAASFEVPNASLYTLVQLYEGAAGWFFLVPATASSVGAASNIQQGTSLTPGTEISSFIQAEAYKDFDGGADTPSLGAVIDSIPSGLSIRGFVNKNAVEGMLRDQFDSGEYPIVAVSSVGYGNVAQRRDKHNIFGVGVGGRIDVYVRNFSDLVTKTEILTGVPGASEGEYDIDIPAGVFPGACWVKSVSDPYSNLQSESESVLNSLAFRAERTADTSGTWHDFDADKSPAEAFNTIWQGFRVHLVEVPAQEQSADGLSSSSAERQFKVTVWCLPQAEDLQSYVDRDDIRSISTDVVVRCPIICNVSVNAVVQYNPKMPIDVALAKSRIRTYINGLGFVGRLSRSEIVYVLKSIGAVSVDMPNKDMLYGSLHDAMGVEHVLSGDALDVNSIASGPAMLSKETVIFAIEDRNIQIKLVPTL